MYSAASARSLSVVWLTAGIAFLPEPFFNGDRETRRGITALA